MTRSQKLRFTPFLTAYVTLFFTIASSLHGQATPNATVPATAAGQAVYEWLDAFNSADSTKLRAYFNRYQLVRSMTGQLNQRQVTGGFDLVSVEKSTPRYIEFVVKERARPIHAVGVIKLNAEGTPGMKLSSLVAIPSGKTFADFTIDSARRASVIDRASGHLNSTYVFPDVAQRMEADARARLQRGEYNDVTNGITFAALLTEHFREVSKDKHLGVNFSAGAGTQGPPPGAAPSGPPSCGFTVSREPIGNIGVVKFNQFANPNQCGSDATKALEAIADADALIIDLRENGGGSPAMVAHISSYLFDQRTHLNDIWTRSTNETAEFWTQDVPGRKYGGTKPIYVLTSSFTFSGAEEFSYNLKALKRATIVGEQTGGGAHPTRGMQIDNQFMMGVPYARSINPITRTNWEGGGVTPDVKVPAAEALETAKKLIAQKTKA